MPQCIDERTVVGAMAGRLHDHIARESEVITQGEELLLARVTRRVLALRCVREKAPRSEHVAMRVHRAFWRPEVWFRRIGVPVEPTGCLLESDGGFVGKCFSRHTPAPPY